MQRLPHLRIVIDAQPQSGEWNMAVDEVLLEAAISTDVATLRWYRWNEPTVSLGYFQKTDELASDGVLSALPRVRRLSGGGAIVHDDELTYCLALPASQNLIHQPHELYDIVHKAIVDKLRHFGYPATIRGQDGKRADEPLLCFQRRNAHDITLNGKKILGSAQRRRRGAIMQHGSLILRASPVAPQVPGLADLTGGLEVGQLLNKLEHLLAIEVARAVAKNCTFGRLTEFETQSVQAICEASIR